MAESTDSAAPGSGDRSRETIRRDLTHDGRDRYYEVHLPINVSRAAPLPVVLNLHGGGRNPAAHRAATGMDSMADRNGFLVVYPAGTGDPETPKSLFFNSGVGRNYANRNDIDDLGFLRRVLEDVSELRAIDATRVYATGFSNGAMMCFRAAMEAALPLAAIATVSGAPSEEQLRGMSGAAIPLMHMHGTADPFVPYTGGTGRATLAKANLVGIEDLMAHWCRRRGIPVPPARVENVGAACCRTFGDVGDVVLWTIEGGGHDWPGSATKDSPGSFTGPVNMDFRASEKIWEFLARWTRPPV